MECGIVRSWMLFVMMMEGGMNEMLWRWMNDVGMVMEECQMEDRCVMDIWRFENEWDVMRNAGVWLTRIEIDGWSVRCSDVVCDYGLDRCHRKGDVSGSSSSIMTKGLRNDLRICSFRSCKELFSHLATPAKEECPDMEKELMDKLKDMEKERDDWRQTTSDQVERIKKLEEVIEPKSNQLSDTEGWIQVLKNEKTVLVAELAQAEIDRQKIVREFVLAVVNKLHSSVEYRRSLAFPIGLCFTASWLGGLSQGRKEEEIAAMLFETSNLDIEGSKTWKDKHRELFTKQYPYI
ncbi:hypothetical protein Tco_0079179 [Tanacetum coccineum]